MNTKSCPRCRFLNHFQANFCVNCGLQLMNQPQYPRPQIPIPHQPHQPYPQQPMNQPQFYQPPPNQPQLPPRNYQIPYSQASLTPQQLKAVKHKQRLRTGRFILFGGLAIVGISIISISLLIIEHKDIYNTIDMQCTPLHNLATEDQELRDQINQAFNQRQIEVFGQNLATYTDSATAQEAAYIDNNLRTMNQSLESFYERCIWQDDNGNDHNLARITAVGGREYAEAYLNLELLVSGQIDLTEASSGDYLTEVCSRDNSYLGIGWELDGYNLGNQIFQIEKSNTSYSHLFITQDYIVYAQTPETSDALDRALIEEGVDFEDSLNLCN